METLKRGMMLFSIVALLCCTSCKKGDNPENDAMNNEPGSFHDNHKEMESDTTGTKTDTTTSNSTQTDPAAS
ncbi:MAG TPA: hypothetical protein VGB43_00535 [Flavobacterium sp.]|jgi:hypothetical protein